MRQSRSRSSSWFLRKLFDTHAKAAQLGVVDGVARRRDNAIGIVLADLSPARVTASAIHAKLVRIAGASVAKDKVNCPRSRAKADRRATARSCAKPHRIRTAPAVAGGIVGRLRGKPRRERRAGGRNKPYKGIVPRGGVCRDGAVVRVAERRCIGKRAFKRRSGNV